MGAFIRPAIIRPRLPARPRPEKAGHSDQDKVLRAMLDQPGRSLTELAEHLCWYTMEGQPHKQKVHRVMKDLQKAKLVEQRRDGHYVLTKNKGEEEAAKTPEKNYMERPAVRAGQYPDPDKNDVGGPSSSIEETVRHAAHCSRVPKGEIRFETQVRPGAAHQEPGSAFWIVEAQTEKAA